MVFLAALTATTLIASSAFYNMYNLMKVNLPSSLKIIGSKAFLGIDKLSSIDYVGTELHTIGFDAFDGTSYVEKYQSTDNCVYLNNWVIAVKNRSATSFTAKEGTVGIADFGSYADSMFGNDAYNVTSITLPSTLKYIGSYAFDQTSPESLTTPDSIIKIRDYAFRGVDTIGSLDLRTARGLSYVGDGAFSFGKYSDLYFPSAVTYFGSYVFNNNKQELNVHLEDGGPLDSFNAEWLKPLASSPSASSTTPKLMKRCPPKPRASFS